MPSTPHHVHPPPHSGRQIAILIKVAVTQFGVNYYPLFFFSGQAADGPVLVKIGDHVAWYVEVTASPGAVPTSPGYQLTFSDDSLFGVNSLSVPKGGGSVFLTVLPHVTPITMKYTVQVDGIRPSFDPEIQTDLSGTLHKGQKHETKGFAPSKYEVTWLPDTAPADLTCTKNGRPQPFPLTVYETDTFTFKATGASAPPDFSIFFFSDGTTWASPFDLNQFKFPGTPTTGKNSSTGPLTVGSIPKPPHVFTFLAANSDLTNPSNRQTITVAPIPGPPKEGD